MARRKEIDSTPIPVGPVCFPMGDTLTARLSGNAFDNTASLTIFYATDEDAGHLQITNYESLLVLLDKLQTFVAEMQNKGRTH